MTIDPIRLRSIFLILSTSVHLLAADTRSKPVQVDTADKLHQSALARQDQEAEDILPALKVAYEGRLASLGATNPKTIESLDAFCEKLLEADMAVANIAYFRTLVETSSKAFAQTSEQVLRAEDRLLRAEAAIEGEKQNDLRSREQLGQLGLNVDPSKFKNMTPEEAMRLIRSTPQGRLELQKAELNQRQNEIAAMEAMKNPAVQGILEVGQERSLQSLRDRGYSEADSQRLLKEYNAALAANPGTMKPGENPLDFHRRIAELVRTNPAALNSPQLRTNPLSQPSKPQDPRNSDRRLLEAAARTDPQKFQRFVEAGLVRKFARDPKRFCDEQLKEINRSFDSGMVPGYIFGFRRLEIPASALEDAWTMASITASLKGLVMHRETLMLHELARSRDPVVQQWKKDILKLTTQFVQLQTEVFDSRLPGPDSGRNYNPAANSQAYQEVKERLESVRRLAASLSEPSNFALVDLSKSCRALPNNAVFIGYIRYTPDFGGTNLLQDYYGASVLMPDQKTVWVPLGAAEQIDATIADYLRTLASTRSSGTEPAAFEQLSKTLAAAVWKPVAATFPAGTRQVVLSPDSELNRVPFSALFDGTRFVAEDIVVRLVSSCRELLTQTSPPILEKTLSLWGDANFGVRGEAGKGIKGLYYGQLPYSKIEIETVGRLASGHGYSVSLHAGKDATEDSFMEIASPRLLHIATHGIILPLPRSQRTNTIGRVPVEFRREMDRELLPYRAALGLGNMNPGLDSWTTTGISEPGPDGLLTSFEASQLVLHGTELVTLSACDSGTGSISPGEGVFSMRRSFHLAGARQVVASLWQVNDKYAPEFFEKYYLKIFAGTDPAFALTDVQAAELRRLRTLESGGSLREAVRLSGPFLISGFSPDALRN